MIESARRDALRKIAAGALAVTSAVAPADIGKIHTVSRGDTLSAIAKRHGTTVDGIAKLNGIGDVNRLSVGQRLRLPRAVAGQPAGAVSGFDSVSNDLHRVFNYPDLEAAALASVGRETGDTYDYRTWQRGAGIPKGQKFNVSARQNGGYGLFQFTGKSLRDYKSWLLSNGRSDSGANQIKFMHDVYGPSRPGWRTNTKPGSGLSKEQLADWWHRVVEAPAHTIRGNKAYSPEKIELETQRHNRFMDSGIRSVNGVWRRVPGAAPVR